MSAMDDQPVMRTELLEALSAIKQDILNAVNTRFDGIDARFDRIDDYLLQFRAETIARFDGLEQKLVPSGFKCRS